MAMVLHNWLSGDSNLEEHLNLMRNKAQTLFARAADITTEVINAELHSAKKRKSEVHNWMENVQELKSRIDRIEQEVEQGSGNNLRNKILNVIKEIEELLERAAFQNGLTIHDLESSSLPLLTTDMKGQQFESNLRKILSWLMNDEVYKIGVYGVGGVGKTTLATHVYNLLLSVPGKSATVCWVTISQKCTIWELQLKIAKAFNLPKEVVTALEEADEMIRPAMLSAALKKKRENVVILDDMWDDFPLEEVGLPTGENGCKLLLTSRSLDVCRRMECKKFVVHVETLSKEESWSLFTEKLGNYDDLSLEAKDVARSVARECNGLPLGIIVVAASMRGIYDVCEWNTTLEDLKDPTRIHQGMKDKVFPSLQLSFSRLNNVMLQNCFLNCALYPEDWVFGRDELVNHWIMEGHLEEIQSRQKKLEMAHTICNKLVSACLLEVTGIYRMVKMHDLIRDMAIRILRQRQPIMIKAGMQLKEVPRLQEWTEELTKVSLIDNYISEIPSGMEPRCPNLSSLFLHRNKLLMIPDSFFCFLKGLKFLDLSKTGIKRVPNSISDLEDLTALHLNGCIELDYIPSLAKLAKLRLLDLDGCTKLENLPKGMEELVNLECLILKTKDGSTVSFSEFITKLSNLQCLELNYCASDIQMTGMQQLGRLERLIGFHTQDKDNFNKYIKSQHFCQLNSYQLLLGEYIKSQHFCQLNSDKILLGKLSSSSHIYERSICIRRCPGIEGGGPVQLPDNTRELRIEVCHFQLGNLVDALPSFTSLTRLARFEIKESSGIECIWSESSCGKPVLENLEDLILLGVFHLRALAKGRVKLSPRSFSNLKKLKVLGCFRMERLFTPCMLKGQLQHLEVIKICACLELEKIFAGSELDSEVDEESEEVNPFILELPKLRKLTLEDLPNLTRICKTGLICYNTIEKIRVTHCSKLKKLFTPCLLKGRLQNLDEIEIRNCEALEEIFTGSEMDADANEESGVVNPVITELPKLRLTLEAVPNLTSICETEQFCCDIIKEIRVTACSKLKKLFAPCLLKGHLQHLEEIYIRDCNILEEIFVGSELDADAIKESGEVSPVIMELPKLRVLFLEKLPNLTSICKTGLICCKAIERITVTACPKLKMLFSPCLLKDQLQHLTEIEIRDCIELEEIFAGSELDVDAIEKSGEVNPVIVELPKLRVLSLQGLPNLTSICKTGLICYKAITRITVTACPKLKKLFSPCLLKDQLQHLTEIEIRDCIELEEIFTGSELDADAMEKSGEVNPVIVELPELWELSLEDLLNLTSICKTGLICCNTISSIRVTSCPKLKKLFTPCLLKGQLQQLEVIDITYCSGLEEIFTGSELEADASEESGEVNPVIMELPTLRLLYLADLPNLTSICNTGLIYYNTIEEITVKYCRKLKKLFTPCLLKGQLQHLKKIKIRDCIELDEIFAGSELDADAIEENGEVNPVIVELPELWGLSLKDLPNLTSICKTGLICYKAITRITVTACPKLKKLFTPCLLKGQLQHLKKIKIRDCIELEEIFAGSELDADAIEKSGEVNPVIVELPKLWRLSLEDLPNLTSICKSGLICCNTISSIRVTGCPKLKKLFTPCLLKGQLQQLEVIDIAYCSALEEIFTGSELEVNANEEGGEVNPVIVELPELWELSLEDLPNLTSICKTGLICCKTISSIRVTSCPKLKKLFTPCLLKGQLQQLEVIDITYCSGLEEIFTGSELEADANEEGGEVNPVIMELPKLRLLYLADLPNLTSICKTGLICYNTIEEIRVKYCGKLKKLLTPCLLKGQLQHLNRIEIRDCIELEEIFVGFELDVDAIKESGEVNPVIMELSKLCDLSLVYLPNLTSICKTGLICCNTIEFITVIDCPKLKKWPIAHQVLEDEVPSPPPRLQQIEVESHWWESLTWDNPLFQTTIQPFLFSCDCLSSDCDSVDS